MQNFISEDDIEKRTIEQCLEELKYDQHYNCFTQDYLGRKSEREVLSMDILRAKIAHINRKLTNLGALDKGDIDAAVKALTDIDTHADLNVINLEMMGKIRDGVKMNVLQKDGKRTQQTVRFINYDNPEDNAFWVVNQLWIQGDVYRLRPDVIIYVNGIPLITIELKDSNVNVENAYTDNLTRYKAQIPQLMYYNVVLIASNGKKTLTGATFASWEFFKPWLHETDESAKVDKKRIEQYGCSLEYAVVGLLNKNSLLDYVENFMIFYQGKTKICAQNHQFLGVNHAIDRFRKITSRDCPADERGKLGVFWHTQGSGKSFSMVFFARKLKRTFTGNYTFLVVTDRVDLDDQIYKNFLRSGFMNEQYECRPKDSEELRRMLSTQNKSILFTLIQKFKYPQNKSYPLLSDRNDIIVLIDEAHRTQYKSLAENLRAGLPHAMFMAFTGTPLFGSKKLTNQWFGKTVSEYNFMQAVDDDATKPIVYRNHLPMMQQQNPDFTDDFSEIISEDNLTDEDVAKLEKEHATELEVLRRDSRLNVVARDIAEHFPYRGYLGKAMVISVDKFTCVKMYEKVKHEWEQEIQKLNVKISHEEEQQERKRLKKLRDWMQATDMAVIVSQEDGEDEKFRNAGLDIVRHRRKMDEVDENGRDIVDRFKDAGDSLRMVFVCAMWLTGFDAPEVSTLYLDKPMVGHALMQTIARANRVTDVKDLFDRSKNCGEVISYCNLYPALMKAIGIYGDNGEEEGNGGGQTKPEDQPMTLEHQYAMLAQAIDECELWCKNQGIDLKAILQMNDIFQKIPAFDAYADIMMANKDRKTQFKIYDNTISELYDSCLPDIIRRKDQFRLAQVVHYLRGVIDENVDRGHIDSARRHIKELLDNSILPKEQILEETMPDDEYHVKAFQQKEFVVNKYAAFDLSKVDIAKVKEKYKESPHKNIEFNDLAQMLEMKVHQMVQENSERRSFAERLQQILDEYNAGSVTNQKSMDELINLMSQLTDEQQRAGREGLTEQELEVYDMLLKPKLTKLEEVQVKNAAKDLFEKLKEKKFKLFPTLWYHNTQMKQALYQFIGDELDRTLPDSYDRNIFTEKKDKIYTSLLMRGDGAISMFAS